MATPKPKARFVDFEEMLGIESQQDTAPAPVQGGILEMDFSLMESFPNHRFKLYDGQQLDDMVESIRQFGILLPIILWHTEDGQYIILSGHNRKNAAQLAGLNKGPVIIRENLTYEDAVLIVTETNLRQRSFSDMSHSERAYCLAQHYEALKSQGKRNDLLEEIEMFLNPHSSEENSTSSEVQTKSRSDTKLGQDYGLSRDKVAKYIRISNLIDPLILRVDTGEIAFLAAYDLSFVEDTAKQQQIADLMESDSYKVDMKKAELFHSYYETGKLTDTAIVQILSGEKTRKPKSSKPQPVKIKPAVISKYFTPQQTQKEIEETIDKALALYFENQNKEVAS
ncbi:ParB N-terminal domain-containing protein [Lacrimispora sp.]|uniref:ParB N-terminal domain-containing protein n=1 Tax=Lacrimispora sp. TaxID=2719234 RepID=UPI0029E32628|nr:ParB family transcriptional regulator, chromosome partitioning protein [Lacrimispora sp.]